MYSSRDVQLLLVYVLSALVFTLLIRWAAVVFRARRSDYILCLLGLIIGAVLQVAGTSVPFFGHLVALLAVTLLFALLLGLRVGNALGVGLMHGTLVAIVALIIDHLFGIRLMWG